MTTRYGIFDAYYSALFHAQYYEISASPIIDAKIIFLTQRMRKHTLAAAKIMKRYELNAPGVYVLFY